MSALFCLQVCPLLGSQTLLSNAGAVKLHWHSENAADSVSQQPTTVALTCLRADHEGEAVTRFADVYSILSGLSAADRAALRRPDFSFTPPPARAGGVRYTDWCPVLTGPPAAPSLRVTFFEPRCGSAVFPIAFSLSCLPALLWASV